MGVVDTKRGYVGMCNGCSAQQGSEAALSKNSVFTGGRLNVQHGVKAESGVYMYQTWICSVLASK